MLKSLKQILLRIARLPKADQRWIMRQLTPEQAATLERYQGSTLLHEARRFRHVRTIPTAPALLETKAPLPAYCEALAAKGALYAAIVLEAQAHPWSPLFLDTYDDDGAIRQALEEQVPSLKPLVKKMLCESWEESLSFDAHLGAHHG